MTKKIEKENIRDKEYIDITPNKKEKHNGSEDIGKQFKEEAISNNEQGDIDEDSEASEGTYYDKLHEKNRLGFKSRLDLTLRRALRSLENNASKASGLSVENLRKEFMVISRHQSAHEHVFFIPFNLVVCDYRTFLISAIAFKKGQKDIIN